MTIEGFLIGYAVGAAVAFVVCHFTVDRRPAPEAEPDPVAPTICDLHGCDPSVADPAVCLDCRQPIGAT